VVLIIRKFIASLCLAITALTPSAEIKLSAQSALIMHEGGEIVYARNADEPMLIASTTKIMTAIVAIENCELEDDVEIKNEYCLVEGSSMYLKAGESYTVRELLTGLMLVSGNDAAKALAAHCSGTEKKFVSLMNKKARELGLENTHFSNPHGLNAEEHYSSAHDLAKLMAYCMENETFASISCMSYCNVKGQTLLNHNKLLSLYEGCIGGKTGYTEKAGRCLVSCAERNGTRYICVSLSAPDDWNDHIKLYDYAFSNYSYRNVTEGIFFDIPVISGTENTVRIVPEETFVFLENSAEAELIAEMPHFVFAPLDAGEECGSFRIISDGRILAEGKLLSQSTINTTKN